MFACPDCRTPLARTQSAAGIFWVCPVCDGRAVTVPLLRRVVKPAVVSSLWSRTFTKALPRVRPCPSCAGRMQEIAIPVGETFSTLDVCRACQFVWFDPSEFEAMPAVPPPEPSPERMPQEFREVVAMARVEQMARQQAEAEPDWGDLRNLPALLGMPVEIEPTSFNRWPWVTWLTALIVALVSVGVFLHPVWLAALALIPAEWGRGGGMTLLTSFFVHGGIFHLLSNLYFLIVFGDNVENYLGRWRWVLLVVAATVAGDVLHVLADPRSDMPCVGASGGISGLLAFYALRFPQARLGMRIWLRYAWRAPWITFPAWGWFAFWSLLQLLGVLQQVSGFSRVSSLAHVGGALAGVVAWLLWRRIELPRAGPDEAPPRPTDVGA